MACRLIDSPDYGPEQSNCYAGWELATLLVDMEDAMASDANLMGARPPCVACASGLKFVRELRAEYVDRRGEGAL
jgi:hypothetical protein